MNLAMVAARDRSPDLHRQVGACALRWDHTVASIGYNGNVAGHEIDWSDREHRRPRVIHAEQNALTYLKPHEVKLMACTLLPCHSCMMQLCAYSVPIVIYDEVYERDPLSLELAKEFNIHLIQVDNPDLQEIIKITKQ